MSGRASEPKRYRRRDEVVDAVQWHKPGDHPDVVRVEDGWDHVAWHELRTPDAMAEPPTVEPGDWILERADGAKCVMTDADFRRDYEPADSATGPGEATRALLKGLAEHLEDHDGEVNTMEAWVVVDELEAALRECGIEAGP